MMISLIFLVGPAIEVQDKADGVVLVLALLGFAAFVALYWRTMIGGWKVADRAGDDDAGAVARVLGLAAIAGGLIAIALATAIRRVMAGERVLDPALAAAALAEGESPLTPRETEVLGAARGGAPVTDLAGRLHLSSGTVRNYLSSAMQKLGAHSRAEAVRVAEDKGWL
jgi:DNA-binding CsgD family transcriptional regulator